MKKNFDLTDFLKLTNGDGAIIFNQEGKLLDLVNIDKAKNFAAMSSVMIKMANEFSEEIKIGGLKQFIFKAHKGVFVLNNFDKDFIVGVYSEDITKTGMIMLSMDNLLKK